MKRPKLDLSAAMGAYMMPYIGVMTILCIFFLKQYSDYAEKLRKMNEQRVQNIAIQVKQDLKDLDDVKVEVVDEGIKITLSSSIMFDLSVAKIKDTVVPTLQKLSASLKALNDAYLVVVDGHTDDEPVFYGGDFSSNWELSLYRSISVIDFLIREGNNPDILVAAGHGQFSPIAVNDSPEHKAENRRVEILIKRKSSEGVKLENVVIPPAVPPAAQDGAAPRAPGGDMTGKE